MRLIDADELKKKLKLWCYNKTTTSPTFDFVTEFDIDECQTVDAVSREAINNLQKYRYNCGDTSITCVSLASINELSSVAVVK